MTLYQSSYAWARNKKPMSLEDAVAKELDGNDYDSGSRETMAREVRLLQEMMARVVGVLSEEQKLAVLGDGWEKAE